MVTSLEIENFKGAAGRQRIPFLPITLLFGANSAGKSTILQALLYLNELLEHGDPDVDRTDLGGDALALGGFARLVHRHELERSIVLRADFRTPGGLNRLERDLTGFPFPNLDDDVQGAWLEVTASRRTTVHHRGALLHAVRIGVAGSEEPLIWIETGPTLRQDEPVNVRVNLGHPIVAREGREVAEAWQQLAVREDLLRRTYEAATEANDEASYQVALLDGPEFLDGRPLPVFAVARTRLSALPPWKEPLRIIPFGDETNEKATAAAQVQVFLEMVVCGTIAQLAGSLRSMIYLGPLRAVPPRGLLFEHSGALSSWAEGLAAWELLLRDDGPLLEDVNNWLARLGAGCRVVVQQLVDAGATAEALGIGHVDATLKRLRLDTGRGTYVLPSEVGAGIAQVVPVVVAALAAHRGLALVEQPEIHVHPGLQVGLGDLFIEAAANRQLILETHSEHVILRMLRRIRETNDNELPEGAPAFSPDRLSVVYVSSGDEGMKVQQLRVDETGEFVDRWANGFFEERAKELF